MRWIGQTVICSSALLSCAVMVFVTHLDVQHLVFLLVCKPLWQFLLLSHISSCSPPIFFSCKIPWQEARQSYSYRLTYRFRNKEIFEFPNILFACMRTAPQVRRYCAAADWSVHVSVGVGTIIGFMSSQCWKKNYPGWMQLEELCFYLWSFIFCYCALKN